MRSLSRSFVLLNPVCVVIDITVKQLPPPPKFWAVGKLSEDLLSAGKFSSDQKSAKFRAENSHFGEIRGRIEISSNS